MRRILLLVAVSVVVAVTAIALLPPSHSRADDAPAAPQASLPISEVVLYSSGVGFFERAGQVEGKSSVDLKFKVDNINDLLKSMVVQDFDGGRVTTVTYGSRDPLTKTLKSFGVDLTTNPSLGQLLGQVRGEKIELANPNPVTGTILGVEKKQQPAGENKTVEVEMLNVLTDDGLRSIPLNQVQRIKLLNPQLNAELRQALEVLAAGHDTQKKTVAIAFDGEGKRKVSVSYIMETPVWKTSYRLVLDDEGKPFLQGWAIVENTTDDDWSSVKLSLISGRPISFTMDMYEPLYVTRPEVVPELYASLRPPTYGDAMDGDRKADEKLASLKDGAEKAKGARPAAPGATGAAAPELAARRSLSRGGMAAADAAAVPRQQEDRKNLQAGVDSAAAGSQTGELFQYAMKTPISLARQKSAMLPIVNQDVEGAKVSIYNQSVHTKFPLNGFRLKNTSPLHLMQGPITVFDGGTYAGDARIEDLAPGTDRLISYAIDLKVEVEPIVENQVPDLVSVSIKKGTMIATHKAVEARTYNVKNRDLKAKVVLVEHPFRQGWDLKEPSEPTERTRDVYRFAVNVAAGKGDRVHVREEQQRSQAVSITDSGPDVIDYYLKATKVSAKVKDAIGKVIVLRNRAGQTAADRARREARITEIAVEQGRIRENMAKLGQNTELFNRYVKKLDEQETEIENLRKEIETLKTTEAKQRQELNDFLLNLDVE